MPQQTAEKEKTKGVPLEDMPRQDDPAKNPPALAPDILNAGTTLTPEQEMDLLGKRIDLHKRRLRLLIKLTDRHDWTAWPVTDPQTYQVIGQTWSLSHHGCERIMEALGISMTNVTYEKLPTEDGGYMYEYRCIMSMNGRTVEGMGADSTSKGFHRARKGGRKTIAEIDEANVKKSAHSNMLSRTLKMMIGFGAIGDDLVTDWFNQNNWPIRGISFTKGGQGGETATSDEKEKRQKIANMLMEINNGDRDMAMKHLKDLTKFKGRDDKMVDGVESTEKLSGKRLDITLKKVKEVHASQQPPDDPDESEKKENDESKAEEESK